MFGTNVRAHTEILAKVGKRLDNSFSSDYSRNRGSYDQASAGYSCFERVGYYAHTIRDKRNSNIVEQTWSQKMPS